MQQRDLVMLIKSGKKNRSLRDVLEKVVKWRIIHECGIQDDNGNIQKFSLKEAASFVQVPKKTLDCYFTIIHQMTLITDLNEVIDYDMGQAREKIRQKRGLIRRKKIQKMKAQIEGQERIKQQFMATNNIPDQVNVKIENEQSQYGECKIDIMQEETDQNNQQVV